MKKEIFGLFMVICTFFVFGCGNTAGKGEDYFNGKVIEIQDKSVLVECLDVATGGVSEGDQVEVSTDVVSANKVPEMKVGDTIRVVYNDVKETYPLHLGEVYSIYAVDENGDVISE